MQHVQVSTILLSIEISAHLCYAVATYVGRHAEIWSKTVSEHHLGQPNSKQNRNLAKAIAVNEKKARIKKLTKGQTFQVELSLMLVDMKGKHHKVGLQSLVSGR